jgi:hypothetical protein
MPFGLCNTPSMFEQLIETKLRGHTKELCLVYLDGVIMIGCTFWEQLHNLQKALK